MKSTTILAAATALACSLVTANAATTWADDELKGKYAFTEAGHCLFALGGFNNMQQPTNPARSALGSDALAGVYTFDGRGGLTVDDTITEVNTSASVQNTEAPFTQSVNETGSGQYNVEADGSVTITFGVTGNTLNGPSAGATFSIDRFVLSVRPSPDNKTLLVTSTEQVVSTLTTSSGLMVPFICSDSGTAVRVGP